MPNCPDCYNGCPEILFDRCMKYTGAEVEELSICTNEYYDSVIKKIIDYLLSVQGGDTIIPDIVINGGTTGGGGSGTTSTCHLVKDALGTKEANLNNILQAYGDAICSLEKTTTDLDDSVNSTFTFDTSCLTLTGDKNRDTILQATINKVCALDKSVTTIANDYVKATELPALIDQHLSDITTGSEDDTLKQYSSSMVPYVAYEYYGPLSNFDASGKGVKANGFDKVYICNGANGTPDRRGRVAVGANTGVPGGPIDSAVDPAGLQNYQIALKGKTGAFKHKLLTAEMPKHDHDTYEDPHFHFIVGPEGHTDQTVDAANYVSMAASHGSSSSYRLDRTPYDASMGKTSATSTKLGVLASGNDEYHNNTQPSIGANFIMFIP